MTEIPARVAQRAFESWLPGPNGCHISTYSVQSRGYAQIGWWADGKTHGTTAHRAAWTHVHGQPPEDVDIDHRVTCDRRCVNLDHLRELRLSDNRRRPGFDFPLDQQCRRNHPAADRVQVKKGGRTIWRCRRCHNVNNRASKRRRLAGDINDG